MARGINIAIYRKPKKKSQLTGTRSLGGPRGLKNKRKLK